MIKKLITIATILLSISILLACTPKESTILLPNLTGMTEDQALDMLASYKLIVSAQDVINNDIPEGRFVSYGSDLVANDEVAEYTTIILYFSIHANILPNLSGKTQAEVLYELDKLDVVVEIQAYQTSEFPAGIFLNYGNGLSSGDVLENGAEVLVFITEGVPVVNRGLLISKYLEGALYNRAIELYNSTDETIDLSTYHLSVYSDGADQVSYLIELTGTINPNETYMIAYSNSDSSILDQADFTTSQLLFNGNDTITIVDSNNKIVDIIGTIGWGLFYLNDRTLVRNSSVLEASDTFDIGEWDEYRADYDEIFGSHPVVYPTTFTFDSSFLNTPFSEPGGMVLVTYVSIYDGDTAYFTPGFLGEDRLRFIGIDTTEMGSGTLATQARDYVASLLSSATTIYIQHDPASGNVDTYDRSLGLVWADGVLVNYMIVLRGYSQNNYQDSSNALIFNHITLSTWMTNAEKYAKANQLGVWA
ncbi:MAG: lamin tail domain-containing protein [Firmicutes bacterium]|nr:lamin tail domain-containing protein [Bacillota bacterium]